MEPAIIIGAVEAALTLIERLGPIVSAAVKDGQISNEDQLKLDARIQALRPGGNAFAGPEWVPSTT